ncbi:MAG: hypothetical protein E7020_03105 [Alphaproteobacteria bacterium]|nr:hypothetical protein [Alphaproteobacteria bacterium]
MNRKIQKLWAILTGRRRVVQNKREKHYLKSFEVFDFDFNKSPICKLTSNAQTPEEFVHLVNVFMSSVYHFKDFKLKDVKAFNVFASDGSKFLYTIYALVKPYGIFYITLGKREVFFNFLEKPTWRLEKAETFRIYLETDFSSSFPQYFFYLCRLKRGKVRAYGFFKECQSTNGDFECEAAADENNKKFPIRFEKLIV